ncbi:MAG TPA: hypothetical protein VL282_11340 [Tepidisphaeraceae bacterium]|nr:hypothetical protein [Tepidisphaeraceae bacterium]
MNRLIVLACLVMTSMALAEPTTHPSASSEVRGAITEYLNAPPAKEKLALDKALAALHGDVALAAEALRTQEPLSDAKPGTYHGIKFSSGGKAWEYSIHLPAGYDGTKRFPVLVLPDHGIVDPDAGIRFWTNQGAKDLIIFRPVITKYQEDKSRFPNQQFFARDEAIAKVMRDALTHLRLNYAVDHDRFVMTGLSQAGYYTYYYAVSFPDDFAGIVPESAGGMAVRAAVALMSPNLKDMNVRILHSAGDQIVPYADAQLMQSTIKDLGGKVELITYQDSDYPGEPFPQRHPGPHNLRLKNVLEWIPKQKRTLPQSIKRMMRYSQQGNEGQWIITPPTDPTKPYLVSCTNDNGTLAVDKGTAKYLVSPEDVVAKKTFKVKEKDVSATPDLKLMLTRFKALGDPERLAAGQIVVSKRFLVARATCPCPARREARASCPCYRLVMMPARAMHMSMAQLFRGCVAHFHDLYIEIQRLAREGMIRVDRHIVGIDAHHRHHACLSAALGLELHADRDVLRGEAIARNGLNQLRILHAIPFLRRNFRLHRIAALFALERFF